jgi:small subunit ribosomal protein S1
MNTELNKDIAQPQNDSKSVEATKKRKFKPAKKGIRESVTYTTDELVGAEGEPFWNAVHSGQIKSFQDDGLTVTIARDGGTIDVFVPSEELLSGVERIIGQVMRIYLEDVIIANQESSRPFLGSEIKAVELDLLDKAYKAKETQEILTCYVIDEIKGGYAVALFAKSREEAENGFGLRAFLPRGHTSLKRAEGLNEYDNRLINVQLTEFDPVRGNIVVSRRELLVEERKKQEEEFFAKYAVGDEISGEVTAVMPYGVFVNLGPVDGFLHISDISWDKKPRVKELVPVGKLINAKITELDPENKKVKLSIKDLNPDPWQTIERIFKPGSEVEGDIVAFANFGAFVRLKNGVEGLIHMGEITWNRIKHPSQHFKIGDHIKALVLRVDKEARRISLSTKALEMSPVERLSGKFPVGAVIKTKVESIHDFGLFVELDEASNGLVPRSEISWIWSEEPLEKSFTIGQEVEVAILGYDSKRQRVSCSIKRVVEDPWQNWKSKFRRGSTHKVKVLEVKRAGLICELDNELTGFCPRRELAESESIEARPNIKIGDKIEVVVTQFDIARQRVLVSQKAALESETKQAYESYLNEQGRGKARTTLGDAIRNVKLKGNPKNHD